MRDSLIGTEETRGIRCGRLRLWQRCRASECLLAHPPPSLQQALRRVHLPARPPCCSGGQRKRVNVGLELVADPSLLFLE